MTALGFHHTFFLNPYFSIEESESWRGEKNCPASSSWCLAGEQSLVLFLQALLLSGVRHADSNGCHFAGGSEARGADTVWLFLRAEVREVPRYLILSLKSQAGWRVGAEDLCESSTV
jgi:hypothetical protein